MMLLMILGLASFVMLVRRPADLVGWIDYVATCLRFGAYAPVPDEIKIFLTVLGDFLILVRLVMTLNEATGLIWWLDYASIALRLTSLLIPLGLIARAVLLILSYVCTGARVAIGMHKRMRSGNGVLKKGRTLPCSLRRFCSYLQRLRKKFYGQGPTLY